MFNRTIIKYALKKILPKVLFAFIIFVWQKIVIHIIELFDALRLRGFRTTRLKELSHKGESFSLYINPDNGFIDNYIYLYGVYEPYILDIFKDTLKKGMTYVDIGANIGQHSMYAASLVGKTGKVYAFEPIPHIYEQLVASSYFNAFESIIHAKNIALGKENKQEKLHISKKNIGGSSLVNTHETTEEITVTIQKGDEALEHVTRIDFIKIDVEGYEYEVLEGITDVLTKHKPVILVEFSGDFYHKQGSGHGGKILTLLKNHNYTISDIEDGMNEVTDATLFLEQFTKKRKQTNLLCQVL